MQTLRDIAPYLALAAAALALVLLVLVLVLWARVRRLRRAQVVVMGHLGERDLVAHAESLDSQVRNLRDAVEILTDELDDQKRQLDHALTNRAIVRYDAFRDAGGEQSASFALLDQYRSGVVLSAIAARDFARIYVKHLQEGVADRELSPEERQAVAAAVPQPLAPGEPGPRAARSPLLDAGPRSPVGPETPAPVEQGAAPGAAATPDDAVPGGPAETPAAQPAASLLAEEPPLAADEPGELPALEAEATFAPESEVTPAPEPGDAAEGEAGEPEERAGEAPPPLQPLLDDEAFTWEDRPSVRQVPEEDPGAGETAAAAPESGEPAPPS